MVDLTGLPRLSDSHLKRNVYSKEKLTFIYSWKCVYISISAGNYFYSSLRVNWAKIRTKNVKYSKWWICYLKIYVSCSGQMVILRYIPPVNDSRLQCHFSTLLTYIWTFCIWLLLPKKSSLNQSQQCVYNNRWLNI